jgi:diaminopimelate epimerase
MQIKNKELMSKFVNCGQLDSSGGKSPIIQSIVHGIIESGNLDKNIQMCQAFLRNGCNALSKQIEDKLSMYVEFVKPSGGYFLWLKLKDNVKITATELLEVAIENGLQFLPGTKFSSSGGCNDYIRLSFSYYDPEGMAIGIDRLYNTLYDNDFQIINADDHTVKIAVLGYNGRLGSKIVQQIDSHGDVRFVEGIDRGLKMKELDNYDVIIDVSSPDGTRQLLERLLSSRKRMPVVIGTTGNNLPMDLIEEYSNKLAPVALISNFSQGIPQFIDILQTVNQNRDMWSMSMLDEHHVHKKDAPSGTAKTLASVVDGEMPIQSIREGETVGIHTVTLEREDERLIIRHEAKNRELFANGAIEYCKWLIGQEPGLYYRMTNEQTDTIKFSKYTGCGNDFIMVDNSTFDKNINKKQFVQEKCKRGVSIGADGLIFVQRINDKPNTIYWEYYNSDGSNVEMCGNGARCVVQYALDNNMIHNKDNLVLINNFDMKTPVRFDDVQSNDHNTFSIKIAIVKKTDVKVYVSPQESHLIASYMQMGVPHVVVKLEDNTQVVSPNYLGELINKDIDTNVNLYSKHNDTLHIRTYERGVYDETLACGTGCCSVAYIEYLKDPEHKEYDLVVKSGDIVKVNIVANDNYLKDSDDIYLAGPANKVYDGYM